MASAEIFDRKEAKRVYELMKEQGAAVIALTQENARLRDALAYIAKEFNPHCCEDCPCDSMRENAENALASSKGKV